MATAWDPGTRISFGLFEADLLSGELWKGGRKIKLQSQPFRVMTMLIEHPGKVVTREELQTRLWGRDAVGDFDHSIGTAINKIREALGDTADNPRFVETLARRGYRWIAPVSSTPVTPNPLAFHPPADEDGAAALFGPAVTPEHSGTAPSPEARAVLAVPMAATPTEPALSQPASFHAPPGWARLLFAATCLMLLLAAAVAWTTWSRAGGARLLRIEQVTRTGRISPGMQGMENLPAGATDGLNLYVPVLSEGRTILSKVDVHTGGLQPLDVPREIESPTMGDLSPDGSMMLLRSHLSPESELPFWQVPSSGGSALRLANVIGHDATWMPDGKGVLFASGNQLIVDHPADGSLTPFASLPGRAFWLRWSPDGSLLRFTLLDPIGHTMQLAQIGRDGTGFRTLLDDWNKPANECCGVWSGDGRAFVFQSTQAGSSDLWRLNGIATSGPVRVTDGPMSYVAPIAGRSGGRIYFLGLESQSTLERYDPAVHRLVPAAAFLAGASRVEYSRNLQWVNWTDANGRLWRAHADGSETLQLTPDSVRVFLAHWSPDGRRLVLMARQPGRAWQIYLLAAEGGALEPLLNERRNAADPSWAADGDHIVFGRVSDVMGKEETPRALEMLDLKTHAVTAVPGSEGLFSPRWSPDGRSIAALSLDQRRLMLFDVASRTWRTLAETTAADPVWAADSHSIFFHASLAETQPIYRLALPDGRPEQIASSASFVTVTPADSFFCGLAPGDAPLIRTRTATGNLYTLDLQER